MPEKANTIGGDGSRRSAGRTSSSEPGSSESGEGSAASGEIVVAKSSSRSDPQSVPAQAFAGPTEHGALASGRGTGEPATEDGAYQAGAGHDQAGGDVGSPLMNVPLKEAPTSLSRESSISSSQSDYATPVASEDGEAEDIGEEPGAALDRQSSISSSDSVYGTPAASLDGDGSEPPQAARPGQQKRAWLRFQELSFGVTGLQSWKFSGAKLGRNPLREASKARVRAQRAGDGVPRDAMSAAAPASASGGAASAPSSSLAHGSARQISGGGGKPHLMRKFFGRVGSPQTSSASGPALGENLAAMIDRVALLREAGEIFAPDPSPEQESETRIRTLVDSLASSFAGDAPSADAPLERAYLTMHALGAATEGNASRAIAALAILKKGLTLPEQAVGESGADKADAWRAARLMSRASCGVECVEALNEADPPEPFDGSTITPRRRQGQALKVYLEASDFIAQTRSDSRGAAGGRATALRFAEAAMRASSEIFSASELPPKVTLAADKPSLSAYFAWRQGFRDDGIGTPLHGAQKRLHKASGQWIDRAEGTGRVAARASLLLSPHIALPRAFSMNKNPFSAAALGAADGHLATVPEVIAGAAALEEAGVDPDASLKPDAMTREGLKTLMKNLSFTIPKGNSIKFSDGGAAGLANIAGVPLPGVSLTPVAEFKKGRKAVVEIGAGRIGADLFFGVEDEASARIGAKVSTFPALGGFVTVHGSLTASAQVNPKRGVRINTRRSLPDGTIPKLPDPRASEAGATEEGWRVQLAKVVETLLPGGAEEARRKDTPASLWTRLAETFADDEYVSIAWSDELSGIGSLRTAAGVGFGKLFGGAGPYAEVAVPADLSRRVEHRRDTNGNIRRVYGKSGWGLQAAIQGTASANLAKAGPLKLGKATAMSVGATLSDRGKGETFRLTLDGGRLRPSDCYYDVEFTSIGGLAKSIERNKDGWTKTLTAEKISDTLTEIGRYESAAQNYVERWRLKSEVGAKLNALQTKLDVLSFGNPNEGANAEVRAAEERQRLQSEMDTTLSRPESWQPFLFYMQQNTSTQQGSAVQFLVDLATTSGVSTRRRAFVAKP